MIQIKNKKDCSGCTSCMSKCPKQAIKMIEDEEGFKYPIVNKNLCIDCGICDKVCPIINEYTSKELLLETEVLGGWSNNYEYRKNGTSGGVFSDIASYVIKNNGVVCGAIYDENLNVKHEIVNNLEDLKKINGSKYVQSDLNNVFTKIKNYLEKGTLVLFSGTPCQVSGIQSYLGKDYENLITVDLVCHGTPSPKVYRKYKSYLEKKENSKLIKIAFRTKITGWKKYSTYTKFQNGKEEVMYSFKNPYMRGFLKDIYLRPSCNDCKSSKLPRYSDITLGDFWGVSSRYPELDDDNGTSLILINSIKGKKIIENIKLSLNIKVCDLSHAIKGNQSMISSSKNNPKRSNFFSDLEVLSFDKLAKKYFPKESYTKKTFIKIRYLLNSIKSYIFN